MIMLTLMTTSAGEDWYFTVRPYDGEDYGDLNTSEIVTIRSNEAPTHDNPIVTASSVTGYSDENLTCTPQNINDNDGDDVTSIFNWLVDNVPYSGLNMPFDTEYLLAMDYSGYDNHGTVTGASWTTDGIVGGAYNFDGDDYIAIPSSASLGDDGTWSELTVEYWINPSIDQRGGRVINKNEEGTDASGKYMAGFNTGAGGNPNVVFFGITTGGSFLEAASNDNTIPAGSWSHVVGTYKSGEGIFIYINGTLRDSNLGITGTIDSSVGEPLFLCSAGGVMAPSATNRYVNASLDEVRIYPTALSHEQAYQRYMDTRDGLSSTSSIVSVETLGGEEWKCEVTPSDSYADGTTKTSNTMTILPIYFDLTIEVSGSGTTNPAPGVHNYVEDAEVVVTAIPDSGYALQYWLFNDTYAGTNGSYTVVMDVNYNLTAVFAEETELLVDNTYSASAGDADLDDNTIGSQDWYEARSAWNGWRKYWA